MTSDSDVAVTWGEYEQHRSRIEYETRHKIAENLDAQIKLAEASNMSEQFLFGMKLAREVVLGLTKPIPNQELNQPSLF